MKAVILISGGLDTLVVSGIAKSQGYELYGLSINYNQRHQYELECAKKISKSLEFKDHKIISLDLSIFGGSALTDKNIEVPKNNKLGKNIPITYVPGRNTIFLSLAMAYAETIKAETIFLGVNAIDYSNYPDCRPEYIKSFQEMTNLATKLGNDGQGIKIITPIINMSKKEIIQKGLELGLDLSMTSSCYDPSEEGVACGECDACLINKAAFEGLGLKHHVKYKR